MKIPANYNELTPAERRMVREGYVKAQKGRCHYCGDPLDDAPSDEVMEKWINEALFPEGFFKWPIHLHHNHDSGMTIGAVHNRCNAVLWQYHGE